MTSKFVSFDGFFSEDYDVCSKVDFEINKKMHSIDLDLLFQKRNSSALSMDSGDRLVLKTVQNNLNCFLAGGAALALYTGDIFKIKDWDLYFKTESELERSKKEFLGLGFKEGDSSSWAINLVQEGYNDQKVKVQLVKQRYVNTVDDIFNKFDFTVCCFAVHGKTMYYWKQAEEDVENKVFNFIYSDQLNYCITRIARYGEKGYKPTNHFSEAFCNFIKNTPKSKFDFSSQNPS